MTRSKYLPPACALFTVRPSLRMPPEFESVFGPPSPDAASVCLMAPCPAENAVYLSIGHDANVVLACSVDPDASKQTAPFFFATRLYEFHPVGPSLVAALAAVCQRIVERPEISDMLSRQADMMVDHGRVPSLAVEPQQAQPTLEALRPFMRARQPPGNGG